MGRMGFGYGSEWQLLWYLARHRARLSAAVAEAAAASSVEWPDLPVGSRGADQEWKGIDFVKHRGVHEEWRKFWPQRGNPPNWDAVGTAVIDGKRTWLLVEAKAHLGEIRSDCGAVEAGGLGQIRATLERVKGKLVVPEGRDWLNGYYQLCNRLAVLSFLRDQGIATRLVLVYFYGDSSGPGRECPTTEQEWFPSLEAQDAAIGLPDGETRRAIHKVFLPAFANYHPKAEAS